MAYFNDSKNAEYTVQTSNNNYLKLVSDSVGEKRNNNLSLYVPNFIDKCRKVLRAVLPFCVMISVICGFHFTNLVFFKYYPPIANFSFFLIFFTSLFRKRTAIQKIAIIIEGKLNKDMLEYTRNITYVWVGFTFINFLISLWTVFLSDTIWMIYNGCISYMLVGIMFGVEYIVRLNFKKKHGI